MRHFKFLVIVVPFFKTVIINDVSIVVGNQQSVVAVHLVSDGDGRVCLGGIECVFVVSVEHPVFVSPLGAQTALHCDVTDVLKYNNTKNSVWTEIRC